MSDPRGSGFDPYAYLHDTGEHTTSYLPSDDDVVERPAAELDLTGELPLTMTRRQLREARERAARRAAAAAAEAAGASASAGASGAAAGGPVIPRPAGGVSRPADGISGPAEGISGPADGAGASAAPLTRRDANAQAHQLRAGQQRRVRPALVLGVVAGVAAAALLLIFVVLPLLRGDSSAAPSGPPTASGNTEGRTSPLLELLPTTVIGGQFAAPTDEPTSEGTEDPTADVTEGATGEPSGEPSADPTADARTYTLVQGGYVENPAWPEGALESVVGQFGGGAATVTLTASRFGTAEEALAVATAKATGLGTVVEEGVVFPDEDRGYYWIFNIDGLVTIVWTDGELGAYWIVSEDVESALDFYQGLSF